MSKKLTFNRGEGGSYPAELATEGTPAPLQNANSPLQSIDDTIAVLTRRSRFFVAGGITFNGSDYRALFFSTKRKQRNVG